MLSRADWRSEWLIARRHPLLWTVVLGSIALIVFAAGNEAPRSHRELFESITRLSLLISAFILPFLAGALAPVFYLREVEHGMSDIFAAYPQTPRDRLAVRLSSFALLLIGLSVVQHLVIVGMLAVDHPDGLSDLLLRAGQLMALVHLPASLIWVCILARVSCATGKSGMVYLAAAFGWLAYIGLATLTGTPLIAGSFVPWAPLRMAMMLADPYAVTALVNPPPLAALAHSREMAILIGRIGWLVLCYLLVRGIVTIPALRPALENAAGSHDREGPHAPRLTEPWQTPSYFALQLRWTLINKFVLLALAGWAVLVFPEVYGGMDYSEPLSLLTPDSRDALNRVMWDLVPLMGALLLLYAADRSCRMSSMTEMDGLAAATPHRSWRFLAVQLACLWVMALITVVFTLTIVLFAQFAARSSIQVGEYLEQGGQILPGLLLSATAYTALHGIVRSRMAANLAGLALLVLGHSNLAPALGLLHPLWKPISLPLTKPDHVLGLDGNWAALIPFALFWAALCATALIFAVRVYHRGLPYPQTTVHKALLHPAMMGAVLLLAGGVWQGLGIHRMLVSDYALVNADDRARRRAEYERLYADWQNRPQPDVAAVRSHVDFGNDGSSADLRVTMQLVNRSATAINRILVGRNLIDVQGNVTMDNAVAEIRDGASGQSIFRLASPMRRGETRTLHFSTRLTRSVLASTKSLFILRPQFASLPAYQILPVIGFQRELTLRDPARRAEFGLAPLAIAPPSLLSEPEADASVAQHQATFETFVSVGRGRYAVAPGELVRRWDQGDRSHFHFRTNRPIHNAPAFFAVPWIPRSWPAGTLTAEILAPGYIDASNPNLLGMRDTLAWLDRDVAPYPGQTLRLIAAPEFGSSGFALPQVMLISHRRGFRSYPAPDAGFDQAYRRAVHETAHQWFGHVIGYGITEERAFLVESLAKYAELAMVERRYGNRAMRSMVEWEADRLARARLVPADAATPLIDAEDTEDMYSRTTLAFACLRSQVGDAAIVAALRAIATSSQQTSRPTRALDFVRALKRAANRADEPVIDWLLVSNLPIETAMERSGCAVGGSS